jgi:hypothetical protein
MAEEKDKKNKFQQRMDEQAAAMEKAYAELRETYDDPTDEQILAVAGNNLRGYQKKMGNKAGNWGTAFGSNALWGTLNKDTRAALEAGYQAGLEAKKKPLTYRRAESLYTLGEGEGAKKVTRGMQMDARNWGDNIDTDNITPEQVRKLNDIMTSGGFTNFTIPTQQVTTKNEKGEDVTTDVEQNISLYDLLESASPEEIEALEYLGFVDEDGAYVRPHNETFEEKLARKERERERIDLLTQQKALQRQQARSGLADLAAGIGDMIKASGGAIVNPRDYRAMYDSLTEQQKTNYNNYLARMQALKEQEKAKRKEAADRAYQEKMLATQHERDMEKLLQAQGFQAGESALDRDLKRELLEKELKAKKAIAKLGEDAEVAKKVTAAQLEAMKNNVNIPVGNKTYTFGNKEASNAAINAMHGKLWNVLIDEDGNYKPPYSTIIKNLEGNGVEKTEQLRAVVNAALNSDEVLNNQTLLKEIQMYMTQASNGVDAPPPPPPTGGKTYVDGNGNEITETQWLAKSPSDRKLYKEKTN